MLAGHAGRFGLAVFLSFLVMGGVASFLELTPTAIASASSPRGPPVVVVDVLGFGTAPNNPNTFVATLNVSFILSPDDPNQVAGSFNYSLQSQVGFVKAGTGNDILTPIPGRAGWVWEQGAVVVAGTLPGTVYNFFVGARNDTSASGTNSCTVSIDVSNVSPILNGGFGASSSEGAGAPALVTPIGYGDCSDGSTSFASPPGVNAVVVTAYGGAGVPSTTNVSWQLSPDDTNQTVGALDYYLFHTYISNVNMNNATVCQNIQGGTQACAPYRGALDPVDADDSTGIRGGNITGFDQIGKFNNLYLRVMARDNMTHRRTVLSCTVVVSEGILFDAGACGSLGTPNLGPGSGAPSLPMFNVPQFIALTGLDATVAGYMLGGLFLFFLVLGGAQVAGAVGAIAAAALGIACIVMMNLIPAWLVVVIFMVVITIGVVAAKASGGGG